MAQSPRFHRAGWLYGSVGIYVAIAAAAWLSDSRDAWHYAMIAAAATGFLCWLGCFRRYRQIQGLPTSRVASAAQGYVELAGRAELLPGAPLLSPLSRQPCCWYAYRFSERGTEDDPDGRYMESGSSVEHFLLVDDTGQCVVSPEGAEVVTHYHKTWRKADARYEEWLVLPRSAIYAIGEFHTTSAAAVSAREESADVGALLSEWKNDGTSLRARFDANRDGRIDMREWELARAQAQRVVRGRRTETQARSIEGVHLLRKPRDGRLFLIANEIPDRLGSRFRYWGWLHFMVFIGSSGVTLAAW
jgi:hypothetical protein